MISKSKQRAKTHKARKAKARAKQASDFHSGHYQQFERERALRKQRFAKF